MIDWLAVEWVCSGERLTRLRPEEKRAVMRRLEDKMVRDSSMYSPGLTNEDVAQRLGTTRRHVERLRAELPPAQKGTCPVCRDVMWIADGVVEAHPDRLFNECPMSGETMRRGLAALRPDLYQWMEGVAV